MSLIFEHIAALKEKYTDDDDIKRIEEDEARVSTLLQQQEYAELPLTKVLLELCRKDMVSARYKLATDRTLIDDSAAMQALWAIVDARAWVIKMVGADFKGELDFIEKQLAAELQK